MTPPVPPALHGPSRCALVLLTVCAALTGCAAPVERTVSYDDRLGRATMDVYLPSEAPGAMRPAILLFHGGGWRFFDKSRYRSVARRFARSGYVAMSANYRLVPEGQFPNAPHDAACALAYVQNHADEFGVDPDRIALMGYSAGAHLAALVATGNDEPDLQPDCAEGAPDKPAAVISGAGPMNMRELRDASIVREFLGGRESDIPEIYAQASPITHVSADDPPFLFVQGQLDLLVHREQSSEMRDALRDVGVEATMLGLGGTGHAVNPNDDASALGLALSTDSPEAWAVVLDFLDRHIGRP